MGNNGKLSQCLDRSAKRVALSEIDGAADFKLGLQRDVPEASRPPEELSPGHRRGFFLFQRGNRLVDQPLVGAGIAALGDELRRSRGGGPGSR